MEWAGDKLVSRIAELEAEKKAVIDASEAAVRTAWKQRKQAEAERDAMQQGYEILATKLSEANAELVRLETQPRSGQFAELEAERDALEDLVEELDPHHLKRNKMGIRRLP